jgi:hypothetical protein
MTVPDLDLIKQAKLVAVSGDTCSIPEVACLPAGEVLAKAAAVVICSACVRSPEQAVFSRIIETD